MPGGRIDPLTGYHFALELKSQGLIGSFREVSGLQSEQQVIEYKGADEKGETRLFKVPGTIKYSDITMKRGMTNDTKLWVWRKARTNGSVVLYDQANGEVARWNFFEGWPTKVSGPSLNATSNDIAVEECVIAIERLERVK
jgi:phage tail-like protein